MASGALRCGSASARLRTALFTLSDAYFDTCFRRVKSAVRNLADALPHLRVPDAMQAGSHRKVG